MPQNMLLFFVKGGRSVEDTFVLPQVGSSFLVWWEDTVCYWAKEVQEKVAMVCWVMWE